MAKTLEGMITGNDGEPITCILQLAIKTPYTYFGPMSATAGVFSRSDLTDGETYIIFAEQFIPALSYPDQWVGSNAAPPGVPTDAYEFTMDQDRLGVEIKAVASVFDVVENLHQPDPMVQVESALMTRLGATLDDLPTDAQLAALLPGGVHSRTAGGGEFPYLNVILVRMATDYTFTRPWRHRFLYNIAVTDMGDSIDKASAVLERVYDLLQDVSPGSFPMEDFTLMYLRRGDRTGTSPTIEGQSTQRLIDEYRIEVTPNG